MRILTTLSNMELEDLLQINKIQGVPKKERHFKHTYKI